MVMVKAWMEDKAIWLFDLAHGDLDDDAVLRGFLKHYVLQSQGIDQVQQDLHFHTNYGDFYMESAMNSLRRSLELQIEAPPPIRNANTERSKYDCESCPCRGAGSN